MEEWNLRLYIALIYKSKQLLFKNEFKNYYEQKKNILY